MPISTISANSAMRTMPASTIGEIGARRGLAATASASGDSAGGLSRRAARRARTRSSTAAALDALIGRMSVGIAHD